ncbi:MAG: 50S ribosomal protein L17 [Treponema sp.]|jgi:large subunit ribosomal protein L17|nr:50S ribosomal protein L17 [Treponema sp.]
MKHRRGFNPLDRMASHRKAMIRNMITSLFRYERIRTTKAKALEVRRFAEKLITRGKIDSVHNRRIASSRLYDESVVAKLFTDIGPRMKDRDGGYTRILKLGERIGDAAQVVLLELVDYKLDTKETSDKKAKKEEKKAAGKEKKEKADAKSGVRTEKKADKV